ncbi:MAG: O-antigen ligase family protein [Erysipelotrichaceae bacterium]
MDKLMSRLYFKLFFIFFVFTNTLSLGYFKIETNPLVYLVMIWSILLFGYEIYSKKMEFKRYNILLLILYASLLLFATYLNKTYSNMNSYIMCFTQFIIFIFIFSNPKHMTLDDIKHEIRIIIPFSSVLVFIGGVLSLFMFLFNLSLTNNGAYLGLVGSRLFGVYFNCNPASILACMMIVFAFIAIRNKYKYRFFYIINIIIQTLYIILTGCRVSLLILALIIFGAMYYKVFKDRKYSKFRQIALAFVTCILVLFGSGITQKALLVIPQVQGLVIEKGERFQFEKMIEIASLIKEGKSENIHKIIVLVDDISSGRVELLHTSYQVWKQSPIFGIGANNFRRMGMMIDPGASVIQAPQVVHAHNLFVEALLTSGVFGLCIMLVFAFKSFIMIWNTLKKYAHHASYFIVLMMSLLVLSEFIAGMFDYGVFYVYSLSSTIAWCFLGYLYWFNDHQVVQLVNSSSAYEFINYHLCNVNVQRKDKEVLKKVKLDEISREIQGEYFIIKIRIQYLYEQSVASFIYDGSFKIIDQVIIEDEMFDTKRMQEELYDMVQHDIKHLMNDVDERESF